MKNIILKIRTWVTGFNLFPKKSEVDQTIPVKPIEEEIPWKEISIELYEALKCCCGLYPLAVAKQKEAMEKYVKVAEHEQSKK